MSSGDWDSGGWPASAAAPAAGDSQGKQLPDAASPGTQPTLLHIDTAFERLQALR
jgi:hypothetical protein